MPGLLIEYLVVGSTALLWLFPLLRISLKSTETVSIPEAAALAPSLYVLGMLVDSLAFVLVSYVPTKKWSLKTLVRNKLYRRYADKGEPFPPSITTDKRRHATVMVFLQQHAPKLCKEVELRSSRDRIARCTVVNLLLASLILATRTARTDLAAVCAFCVPVAVLMWMLFEHSTHEFESLAYLEALKKKDNVNTESKPSRLAS